MLSAVDSSISAPGHIQQIPSIEISWIRGWTRYEWDSVSRSYQRYVEIRESKLYICKCFRFEKDDDDNSVIFPIRLTRDKRQFDHVNLLLLSDGEGNSHYCLIKDMSSLIAHRTKHNGRTYVCDYCIHPFTSEKALNNHIPLCSVPLSPTGQISRWNEQMAIVQKYLSNTSSSICNICRFWKYTGTYRRMYP